MYLYELAIELGERSADIVEKAEALGIGPILATAELAPEQLQALRAAYRSAAAPAPPGPATTDAAAPPPQQAVAAPAPQAPRSRTPLVIGALVVAVIALAAFFMMQSEPNAEREDAIAADLDGWKDGPPATVSPSVAAEAGRQIGRHEPLDQAAMCRAYDVVLEQEARTAGSLDELRALAADNGVWRQALDDMVRFGPAAAEDEIEHYRDTVAKYDAVLAQSNEPELRDYLDGTPRYALKDRKAEVAQTQKAMEGQVVPFCGADGSANDEEAAG
ncbi:MAG: hypothetical protein ACTHN0_12825 [Aquihabitans sp.]